MSRNLTASWNKSREVPSWFLGWSLCGFLALGAIASTPTLAQLPTSEPGNNNSPIAQTPQTGAIVRPALKVGSRGSDVTELQAALKLLGFYNGEVDGIFSKSTAKAVSEFQAAAGVAPDGIVGQDTWNRLFPAAPSASVENPIVFSIADITAVVAIDFARVVRIKPGEQHVNLLRWREAMALRPSFSL